MKIPKKQKKIQISIYQTPTCSLDNFPLVWRYVSSNVLLAVGGFGRFGGKPNQIPNGMNIKLKMTEKEKKKTEIFDDQIIDLIYETKNQGKHPFIWHN